MPEPLRIPPGKTFGRENLIFIPAIASVTGAPTVAEATATSGLDITNLAFADGATSISGTTNRVRLDRTIGETSSGEFIGETTYEGGELVIKWLPQAAALSDGKKAWEKFPEGTTGFLAKREDVARATALAAGQFLSWVAPVEFGPPIPTKKGDNEAAQTAFRVTYAVTDPAQVKFNVAILA